jgi:hypothetical protein
VSAGSLADEFARLEAAATPGPWRADLSEEGVVWANYEPVANTLYWPSYAPDSDAHLRNAAFIAFCGSHRAEILAALRAADALALTSQRLQDAEAREKRVRELRRYRRTTPGIDVVLSRDIDAALGEVPKHD